MLTGGKGIGGGVPIGVIAMTDAIALTAGLNSYGVAVNSSGDRAYVTNANGGSVSVISNGTITPTTPGGNGGNGGDGGLGGNGGLGGIGGIGGTPGGATGANGQNGVV